MAKRSDSKVPRQRKLGAITPEVIGDMLPVSMQTVPTSAAEFDGWTPDEVSDWLKGMGGAFRQVRSVIGLALWALRDKLKGEKEYVAYAHELAEVYDVSVDTLTRWRRSAQVELGLPDPAGAAALATAARKGAAAQSARRNAPIAKQVEEQEARSDAETATPPTAPTTTDQPVRPVEQPKTVEERHPVEADTRSALDLPAAEAIEALLWCKPTEARDLPAALFAKLESWVEQARAVRNPVPAQPARVQRAIPSSINRNGCTHKDAAGKETVNKLPYAVVCSQCGTKVR